MVVTSDLTPAPVEERPAALRFGTDAFYTAIGRAFLAMCATVPVLYLLELLDVAFRHELDVTFGILPRRFSGLDGVLFAPLFHVGFLHLAANAVPLILLGTFALAGQTRRFILVTAVIVVVSGLAVWLFGRSGTLVVGASGVVFGYLGYLLLRGIVERSPWNIAVAVFVGLVFGWPVVDAELIRRGAEAADVAWQGHLGGFLAGLAAAFVLRPRRPRPEPPTEESSDTTLTLPLPPLDTPPATQTD